VTLNDLGSGLIEVNGSVHGKILADPVAGIHAIAPSAPPSVSPAPKTPTLRRLQRAAPDAMSQDTTAQSPPHRESASTNETEWESDSFNATDTTPQFYVGSDIETTSRLRIRHRH